jgi:hypothetical protein
MRIASARKPKKSKIVSPKTEQILSENDKITEGDPIKVVSAEPTETDLPYTTMAFVSSVIPLILVRRYLIGA